jgi:hypothetical protein
MPVRLILGVNGEKRVQRAETAHAIEAEKWRYFTVSTVFVDGRFDSRLYMATAELGTRRFLAKLQPLRSPGGYSAGGLS